MHKSLYSSRGAYDSSTEVAHSIDDKAFLALKTANLIGYDERDWQTKRAYARRGHAAHALVHNSDLKALLTKDGADDALAAIRVEVLGEDAAAALAATGLYHHPWLNGPFALHTDAAAELAAEKTAKGEERERLKAAKAAREAAIAGAKAFAAEIADDIAFTASAAPAHPRLPRMLADEKILFPVHANGAQILTAAGTRLADIGWQWGERAPAIAQIVAAALNLAHGSIEVAAEPDTSTEPAEGADAPEDAEVPGFLRRLAS